MKGATMTSEPDAERYSRLDSKIWNSARQAIFVVDASSNIIMDSNPAAEHLTGYACQELIGMHVYALHPEDEHERVADMLRKAMRRRLQLFDGLHILFKDGRQVRVVTSASLPIEFDGKTVVLVTLSDAADQEQTSLLLLRMDWALAAYSSAALALKNATTKGSLLQSICEAITNESAYVLALAAIAEDGLDKPIKVVASAGRAKGHINELKLNLSADDKFDQDTMAACIRANEIHIIEDVDSTPLYDPWSEITTRDGVRSVLAIPFSPISSPRGCLAIYSAHINVFEASVLQVFQRLAAEIEHGFHALDQEQSLKAEQIILEETQTQLSSALSATVTAIAATLAARDPFTAGHQDRVGYLACAIGREMGWSESRLQGLRMASVLHDIGKIGIPLEILTKPSRLGKAELELIGEHPEIGYNILKGIPFPWPIADIVRQHHERLDGSGYPLGLKADAILIEARVLAVADIVEAMTSHRPYRQALGVNAALEEIERQAGTLLDAEAVQICQALFREKSFVLHS
jgi:PAS domain S-box-containing protein